MNCKVHHKIIKICFNFEPKPTNANETNLNCIDITKIYKNMCEKCVHFNVFTLVSNSNIWVFQIRLFVLSIFIQANEMH